MEHGDQRLGTGGIHPVTDSKLLSASMSRVKFPLHLDERVCGLHAVKEVPPQDCGRGGEVIG